MDKVIVGMSGGVDSSVAAAKLIEAGYEVIGVTATMWDGATADIEDAQAVCNALGIRHIVADMRDVFRKNVVDYFVDEYCRVRTPNPCNMCNRFCKWQALIQTADSLGAKYVATGHYARIRKLENGRYTIANSETAVKDQTYALCFLTQEQLSRTLMPLGDYTKDQVRKMANALGIPVANKKDSQDICFIPNKDYREFIDGYIEQNGSSEELLEKYARASAEGDFVDCEGRVLGRHKGLLSYTYGQRRGLGVSAKTRLCVIDMDPQGGSIVLGEDETAYRNELTCSSMNWMAQEHAKDEIRALVKIRYAHRGEYATVYSSEGVSCRIVFDNPVRAITPGQPVVLYSEDYVLGAGIIDDFSK